VLKPELAEASGKIGRHKLSGVPTRVVGEPRARNERQGESHQPEMSSPAKHNV
jgi:hypothetical protein